MQIFVVFKYKQHTLIVMAKGLNKNGGYSFVVLKQMQDRNYFSFAKILKSGIHVTFSCWNRCL